MQPRRISRCGPGQNLRGRGQVNAVRPRFRRFCQRVRVQKICSPRLNNGNGLTQHGKVSRAAAADIRREQKLTTPFVAPVYVSHAWSLVGANGGNRFSVAGNITGKTSLPESALSNRGAKSTNAISPSPHRLAAVAGKIEVTRGVQG